MSGRLYQNEDCSGHRITDDVLKTAWRTEVGSEEKSHPKQIIRAAAERDGPGSFEHKDVPLYETIDHYPRLLQVRVAKVLCHRDVGDIKKWLSCTRCHKSQLISPFLDRLTTAAYVGDHHASCEQDELCGRPRLW